MERIIANPFHLKYVVKQTEDMCLAALRNEGMALEYVKEKTEKLVLEAVRNSGFALQFS